MLKTVQQPNDERRRAIEAGDIMEMCLSALIDTSLCVPSFICDSVTQYVCVCVHGKFNYSIYLVSALSLFRDIMQVSVSVITLGRF